jgi:transposase InsO family protein
LYRLIEEESQRQPVSRLCRTLGVTRSGLYDWQRQPLSDRALADWLLSEQIRSVFEESEQTYGSPRVFKELKLGRGLRIGEKRVARLMRQAGLRSIHAKRRKAVIAALVEGNSIRSTVRMTGVAKNTVAKLLVDLGYACAAHHDAVMVLALRAHPV